MAYKDPEAARAYWRAYREANKERIAGRRKARDAANKELRAAARRRASETNKEKEMFASARWRANKMGREFNIELSDIRIPSECPVLGIAIKRHGSSTADPASASLDRIDSSKGYIKGNVRVISLRANVLKRDMTLEEARLIYEDLLRFSSPPA